MVDRTQSSALPEYSPITRSLDTTVTQVKKDVDQLSSLIPSVCAKIIETGIERDLVTLRSCLNNVAVTFHDTWKLIDPSLTGPPTELFAKAFVPFDHRDCSILKEQAASLSKFLVDTILPAFLQLIQKDRNNTVMEHMEVMNCPRWGIFLMTEPFEYPDEKLTAEDVEEEEEEEEESEEEDVESEEDVEVSEEAHEQIEEMAPLNFYPGFLNENVASALREMTKALRRFPYSGCNVEDSPHRSDWTHSDWNRWWTYLNKVVKKLEAVLNKIAPTRISLMSDVKDALNPTDWFCSDREEILKQNTRKLYYSLTYAYIPGFAHRIKMKSSQTSHDLMVEEAVKKCAKWITCCLNRSQPSPSPEPSPSLVIVVNEIVDRVKTLRHLIPSVCDKRIEGEAYLAAFWKVIFQVCIELNDIRKIVEPSDLTGRTAELHAMLFGEFDDDNLSVNKERAEALAKYLTDTYLLSFEEMIEKNVGNSLLENPNVSGGLGLSIGHMTQLKNQHGEVKKEFSEVNKVEVKKEFNEVKKEFSEVNKVEVKKEFNEVKKEADEVEVKKEADEVDVNEVKLEQDSS